VARAWIDIPPDLAELMGDRQWGWFLDAVVPIWSPRIRGLDRTEVSAVLRAEQVDFNQGTFSATGQKRFDEINAVTVGLSFRPVPGTVFRLNHRREWFRDLQGNPAARTAGWQLGFATYF
jgi:hypothetical protein